MPRSRILVAVVAVALTGVSCYQDPKAALDAMEETLALQSTLEELGSLAGARIAHLAPVAA